MTYSISQSNVSWWSSKKSIDVVSSYRKPRLSLETLDTTAFSIKRLIKWKCCIPYTTHWHHMPMRWIIWTESKTGHSLFYWRLNRPNCEWKSLYAAHAHIIEVCFEKRMSPTHARLLFKIKVVMRSSRACMATKSSASSLTAVIRDGRRCIKISHLFILSTFPI